MLQQFIDALDSAIEVNRFDVPSTSSSPTQLIHYRFSRHAWLVSKMLNQLDYQQVDVPGVSWGGALAQQFAFQYSRRCWRLIMVSTATGAFMVPGELLRAFVGHPRVVYALAWSPSGDEVVSSDSDGMLRWWNVHSRECGRVRLAHRGTIRLLRRSPDGSRLASCGDDEAIKVKHEFFGCSFVKVHVTLRGIL